MSHSRWDTCALHPLVLFARALVLDGEAFLESAKRRPNLSLRHPRKLEVTYLFAAERWMLPDVSQQRFIVLRVGACEREEVNRSLP